MGSTIRAARKAKQEIERAEMAAKLVRVKMLLERRHHQEALVLLNQVNASTAAAPEQQKQARALEQKIREVDDKARARYKKGRALERDGAFEQALEAFGQAVSISAYGEWGQRAKDAQLRVLYMLRAQSP